MTTMLDLTTESGAHAAHRLHHDMTAWLTSADAAGTPQPAPVWFLWNTNTSSLLLYSQPSAKRLNRIRTNPRSSLHLNDDGEGHDYLVLTGTLHHAPGTPPADQHPAYLEKYAGSMTRVFGSTERFSAMFTVPLLFHATTVRGG